MSMRYTNLRFIIIIISVVLISLCLVTEPYFTRCIMHDSATTDLRSPFQNQSIAALKVYCLATVTLVCEQLARTTLHLQF